MAHATSVNPTFVEIDIKTMTWLVEQAVLRDAKVDVDAFKGIANELWRYFQLGGLHSGVSIPSGKTRLPPRLTT